MDKFNCEENFKGLSEKQLDLVISVFKEHGFENGNIRMEAVGKAGDNFAADVKRIIIDKDGKVFKMIAKFAPTSEEFRMAMNSVTEFNNERIMYTKVLPKFTEMEIKAGIEEDERLKYTKYYGTLMETHHEMILLEDLKEADFCMLDKFLPLTDDAVRLVLKNLTKLHSMSFVLNHQDPETFVLLSSEVTNMWTHFDTVDDMKTFFGLLEAEVIEFFDDDKIKDTIRGSVTQLAKVMIEKMKMDLGSKYSVIQHGDCWTNNFMFKLKDNKTVDCCMIDYQFSCASNPAVDILYAIFLCTDYDSRSKHFKNWMNYYFNELAKSMKKFGLEVDDVYPREQLDADLKRMGKAAFGHAVMASCLQLRETHEMTMVQDALQQTDAAGMPEMIERMKLSNSDQHSMDRFNKRFDGLVKTFFELEFHV